MRASYETVLIATEKLMNALEAVQELAAEHNVTVLLAVEAGSRMWGLASPSSDSDVRFIYVHKKLSEYLSVFPGRDVIEAKIGVFDISGWDVRKALSLAQRSNSSLVEWLLAPEPLFSDASFVPRLREVMFGACSLRSLGFSWLTNARNDLEKCIGSTPEPVVRDYLYVLRPALCVRWILDHHNSPDSSERLPPARFLDALSRCAETVPGNVAAAMRRLAEAKIAGGATERRKHDLLLEGWVADVFAEWKRRSGSIPHSEPSSEQLNALFFETVLAHSSR